MYESSWCRTSIDPIMPGCHDVLAGEMKRFSPARLRKHKNINEKVDYDNQTYLEKNSKHEQIVKAKVSYSHT